MNDDANDGLNENHFVKNYNIDNFVHSQLHAGEQINQQFRCYSY